VDDSKPIKTDEIIAWAKENCPLAIRDIRAPLQDAKAAYDAVDNRLGDDAEHDEFLSKILWMETTVRLAQLGWTVEEFESAMWPTSGAAGVLNSLMRE
jgi:hypothetical protein